MTAPQSITGLVARFRASDITGLSDGDQIASWTDPTTSVVWAQGSAPARPIYKTGIIGGKAVARLDGISAFLQAAVSLTGTAATVVFIGRVVDPTMSAYGRYASFNNSAYSTDHDNATSFLTGVRDGVASWWLWRVGGRGSMSVTTGTAFTGRAALTGTNAVATVDGTSATPVASTGTLDVSRVYLGVGQSSFAPSDYLQIDAAEILVYNREVTSGEGIDLDSYAKDTYGTTAATYNASWNGTPSPAVSYVASSAAVIYSALNGTSVAPTYPAGITDGDYAVMFVAQKPTAGATTTTGATITTPSGWTLLGQLGSSVTTAVANDVGPTKLTAFGRVAAATDSGASQSVTIAGTDVAWAHISVYHRAMGSSGQWDVAAASGQKTTGGASYTATMGTNPGITTGDHVVGALAIPTDVTTPAQFTAEALTATGATIATPTEIVEPDTGTGTDAGGVVWRTNCTAGTASAAPVFATTAATTNTNVYGPTVMVRLRETAAATSVENGGVATSWAVAAQVTATTATAWAVTGQVTATKATAWNVATPVAASTATAWGVRSAVSTGAASAWAVQANVAAVTQTAWAVLAPVSTSAATAWGVRSPVAATSAQAWTVRSAVSAAVASSWAVTGQVSTAAATSWSVASVVTGSTGTAWAVAAPIAATAGTSWAVLAPVAASAATGWAVTETVDAAHDTGWGVSSTVAASMASTWGALAGVSATVAASWAVLQGVDTTCATAWAVAEQPGSVTGTRVTSWAVSATVTASAATAWGVLEPVATSAVSAWAVRAGVSTAAATAWAVRQPVAAALSTVWAVDVAELLTPVVVALATEWVTSARVTVSTASAWAVGATVAAVTVEGSFTATATVAAWSASASASGWSASATPDSWTATLEDA